MIGDVSLFTLIVIAVNVIVSYLGLRDRSFFGRYLFNVGGILSGRQYERLVTSGFLHVNAPHLIFNMFAYYSFSRSIESVVGPAGNAVIYLGSLFTGSLLSLYSHRSNPEYSAVGASGAVSGVIFADIVLFPEGAVSFLFLPVAIPSWLFGIGFVLVSMFGIRRGFGNVGHAAHLGGAIAGVLLVIMLEPGALLANYAVVAALLAPSIVYLLVTTSRRRPGSFRVVPGFRKKREPDPGEVREMWREVNELLDRMGKDGPGSLSDIEQRRLRELSKRLKRMQKDGRGQ